MSNSPTANRLKNLLFSIAPFLGVIVILLGVSGILIPERCASPVPDPEERAERYLDAIVAAFHHHHADLEKWPAPNGRVGQGRGSHVANLGNYTSLFAKPRRAEKWNGPYLQVEEIRREEAQSHDGNTKRKLNLLDPWGRQFKIHDFPPGWEPDIHKETVVAVCSGPNGVPDTTLSEIAHGHSAGDDLIRVIR